MSISIYDIAKKAGVSPSTVSRALEDHPRIGAATRKRIQALAIEMNYVPSTVAKSLATNKTCRKMIGSEKLLLSRRSRSAGWMALSS